MSDMEIEVAPDVPVGLAERGAALWIAETKGRDRDTARETLLLEACRLADRLDAIDSALRGSVELLRIMWTDETEIVMRVDNVVVEGRQSSLALAKLVSTIRQMDAKPEAEKPDSAPKSKLDEIAEQRAKRLAGLGGA